MSPVREVNILPKVEENELGAVLRLSRQMAGLSEENMAKACRVGQSMISMIESGQREPSLKIIRTYAHETGHEGLIATVAAAVLNGGDESDLIALIRKSVRLETAFSLATERVG